jgi:hypothetical protein
MGDTPQAAGVALECIDGLVPFQAQPMVQGAQK